jgi:asparagine synthase (glutamine-hydrolysing)
MSALAGIFKFDPRERIDPSSLARLTAGIDRIGPDGGGEYIEQSVALGYRAFHTTPESHLEQQPLQVEDVALTWDGRLDNREEIQKQVDRRYLGDRPTDLELVLAAYQRWGTRCFAELMGDWAMALWDKRTQQLILARDYIGVRRLFYRVDPDAIVWCSSLEPLVLTAPYKLHLDREHLAGCLQPRPPIETTPYREIRAVVPATFLTMLPGGKRSVNRYWSLNPKHRIRYASDAGYEKHFREVFQQAVRRRLRSDGTILGELSGGLDSSSIICMADLIRNGDPGPAIDTLSYYDPEEPSGDERPFFSIIEQTRGRCGHHISLAELRSEMPGGELAPLSSRLFVASPGYFARSEHWAIRLNHVQQKTGSRVVLSGLGGDELLGGVQYEAPELADDLGAGKLPSFARSLRDWSITRRKTALTLIADVIRLLRARFDPALLAASKAYPPPWVLRRSAIRHSALQSFAQWRQLTPTGAFHEWTRYSLGTQLTSTDPSLVGCAERRYPLLDRSLFEFLAAIPRTQVLRPGARRHLLRRALRGIVPDTILLRKSKWFGERNMHAALQTRVIDDMLTSSWHSAGWMIDPVLFRERFEELRNGAHGEAMVLQMAIGLEQWLRNQVARDLITFEDGPDLPRIHPWRSGLSKLWRLAEGTKY